MIPCNENFLTKCENKFGPTFGEGHDLYIADRCNKVRNCITSSLTYLREDGSKFKSSQFSGAAEDETFRVDEYEVFQIIRE
jgi:hypothetical protein